MPDRRECWSKLAAVLQELSDLELVLASLQLLIQLGLAFLKLVQVRLEPPIPEWPLLQEAAGGSCPLGGLSDRLRGVFQTADKNPGA